MFAYVRVLGPPNTAGFDAFPEVGGGQRTASPTMAKSVPSVQRDPAADVSGNVEVFALMDGGLDLLEAAFGDDLERQLALSHRNNFLALAHGAGLLREEVFGLLRV